MPFKSLGLSDEILRAIEEQGYTEPTPVQQKVIPVILEGSDLLAGAQTGTGKTAGFTLPLLERLKRSGKISSKPAVRALILTPTRELAQQVADSVRTYGKHLPLYSSVVYGGVSIHNQIKTLRRGVDILIATPGRLLDLYMQKSVDLSQVEILVLDEADRMLDMGFIHDIRKILNYLPKVRQNLLFSATFSDEIKGLVNGLFRSPKVIEIGRTNTTAESVSQTIYKVDNRRKRDLLVHLIYSGKWQQVLVFTRTKHGANRLAEQLETDGITSVAFHGNKSQASRARALSEFKKGTVQVLVATDIAARGIDITELPHVVNFDLPNVPEDYVHRIGRTGRAGHEGQAVSLVSIDEHGFLKDIEKLLKRELPQVTLPGFEPDPTIRAQPIFNRFAQTRGPRVRERQDNWSNSRSGSRSR